MLMATAGLLPILHCWRYNNRDFQLQTFIWTRHNEGAVHDAYNMYKYNICSEALLLALLPQG